jgi:hypothetical protein
VVVVDVSRSLRSIGGMLSWAIRLFAVYASVRAALRAEALHEDDPGPRLEGRGRPEGPPKRAARAGHNARVSASSSRSSSAGPSATDSGPSIRSGDHSRRGVNALSYRQLYEEAQRRDVRGRSTMSKAALEAALSRSATRATGGS